MILYINTSVRNFLEFAIIENDDVFLLKRKVNLLQSENALFLLDFILKKYKLNLKDIEKIIVNRGPGSFTSVRLGIVIANTLSYGLKTPIFGIENVEITKKADYLDLQKNAQKYDFVRPYYDREPDITKSNKLDKILKR
ncbi:MAG: hypothetical protein PHZ07_05450 [Patescibacteria group bacterium]|nr:hypothetical protein [Patescibacteria group bacterium]MDD4304886.1 hypothetical protein [Patescibacteria group bacterium]MDD4695846.1 hypothetical protein [Patescibacteria group bacterium]